MVWNVAQRAADGLYSNVWISDAFHELLRSVGCHPTGLAKHKAWKIASRDCFSSHFSWAAECHAHHHSQKPKHQKGLGFVMSSYPAAVAHTTAQQGHQETERLKNITQDTSFWHPPPHLQVFEILVKLLVSMCLNLSSLKAHYSNSVRGRRMAVTPKHMPVVQGDLCKKKQPVSVICLWGTAWVIRHTQSVWKDLCCCCFS